MELKLKINNKTLAATLIKPKGFKKPLPGLIFIHGWKSNRSGNTKRSAEISKLGFICLTLDLRGHGQSGGDITEFSRKDHLEDIKAAYKYLSESPEVDKEKIGIVGSSYGGYLAAVATNYLKFNRLVLRVPALYFDQKFDIPTDKLIGEDETGEAFKSSNLNPQTSLALKGVNNFKGEILLIESEKDEVIPHPVIENYLKFINEENLTYKLMRNAPHSLETEKQELEYIKVLNDWLLIDLESTNT